MLVTPPTALPAVSVTPPTASGERGLAFAGGELERRGVDVTVGMNERLVR